MFDHAYEKNYRHVNNCYNSINIHVAISTKCFIFLSYMIRCLSCIVVIFKKFVLFEYLQCGGKC